MSSHRPDKHPGTTEELMAILLCAHCEKQLSKIEESYYETDNTVDAVFMMSTFGEGKYYTKERVCRCDCSRWKIVANKPIWKEWR